MLILIYWNRQQWNHWCHKEKFYSLLVSSWLQIFVQSIILGIKMMCFKTYRCAFLANFLIGNVTIMWLLAGKFLIATFFIYHSCGCSCGQWRRQKRKKIKINTTGYFFIVYPSWQILFTIQNWLGVACSIIS